MSISRNGTEEGVFVVSVISNYSFSNLLRSKEKKIDKDKGTFSFHWDADNLLKMCLSNPTVMLSIRKSSIVTT